MYPTDNGFFMPPEWTRHQCTFMEWPLMEAEWPGPFEEVLGAYADIVKKISKFEQVMLIARQDAMYQAKQFCGGYAEIIPLEHNDSWMRDNGPTFVLNRNGETAGVNWIFNAWGGKYPCENDNLVAGRILDRLKIKRFDAPFVMEGGSIHVDGEGTLITTEECLLNSNRNPGFSKKEIEDLLKGYLGVKKIIWLKRGLFGDDTDGHVDNVACFAAPGLILLQTALNPGDPNYERSQDNLKILSSETDACGRSLRVIQIEQPGEAFYGDMRLTLSYLNFYFVNGGIILPVFGEKYSDTDEKAAKTLKSVFPDREIVTVNGMPIIRGGGNVHCLTQQMPVPLREAE